MTAVPALPPDVLSYVGDFVTRARRHAMVRAAAVATASFLAWALVCCLTDRLLQLPSAVRAAMLVAGLLAGALIVARPLRSILRRRIDWVQAAAELERRDPRFGQRLLTVTARLLGPAEHRGSDDLLYRLLSDVVVETRGRRPAPAIARRSIVVPLLALAGVLALAAWLSGVESVGLPRLAARFILPLADLDPVTTTRLVVAPAGGQILQSQPLSVTATADHLPPDGVAWLSWRDEDDEVWIRRLMNRETP